MSGTVEKIIRLAAEEFGLDGSRLKPEDDLFESLGIDSVQALELLSRLELEFEVEIPDYELREVKSFKELAARIDRRR